MTNLTKEHAVTDPRVPEASEASSSTRLAEAWDGAMRPLLWILLTISVACNIVTSSADVNVLVRIGFGLVTLGCVAALVTHHHLHRR